MSDEKFEEFLQREARSYNAPPSATPRDEMWEVVAAARAKRPAAGGVQVTSLAARRPGLRYAPWLGMAATLLIGVAIGRVAFQRGDVATVASAPSSSTLPATDPMPVSPSPSVEGSNAGASLGTDAPAAQPVSDPSASATRAGTRAQRPAAARLVANGNAQSPAANGGAESNGEGAEAFQIVSREHLVRAEALVSVIAATPRDAVMDSLTGKWARDMLSNTRLLLDSPAGDDPVRRRLLEDLETVLVQLVQRSGGAVNERELIDRTLDRTQLLTRLRASAAGI
ncbi:MAG: hypothetical protein KF709_09595 [Gemmatimonadaceae bacterium]|nr:hypothetical protein [Gemmatimonadaceae bacterium]